jgi:hypothetical protein
MIQGDFLIATAGHTRSPAALGASGSILARIIVIQILLGGLLGIRVTSRLTNLAPLNIDEAVIAIALGGSLLRAVVLWPGPSACEKLPCLEVSCWLLHYGDRKFHLLSRNGHS